MQCVDDRLISGVAVHRCHEAVLDADGLVENGRDGSQAVGCVRGVGDDFVGLAQLVIVDALDHGDVRVRGGSRDQDLFGAGLKMLSGGFFRGEDAGAFDHNIDPQVAPGKVGRVAFRKYLDAATDGRFGP